MTNNFNICKILLGDDVVDDWEQHLELMVDSVYRNGGRSCINCSSIYASRHTEEIAVALAERLGPIDVLPPDDPEAGLAAFTTPSIAEAIWQMVERDIEAAGASHATTIDLTGQQSWLRIRPQPPRRICQASR